MVGRVLVVLGLLLGTAHAVEVRQAVICTDIVKRNPAGVATRFPGDVGQLYGHVTLQNRGEPTSVRLVWRHDDQTVAQVNLDVGRASRWRTWAKIRVADSRKGPWSLEVVSPEGRRLAYVPFVVGAGGETPAAPVIHRADEAPQVVAKPVEPATPVPKMTAPTAPAAPQPGQRCRAAVAVRVEGEGRARYFTAEVDLERYPIRVRQVSGLVVLDNGKPIVLHVAHKVAKQSGPGGEVLRRWDQLVGVPLEGGPATVWYAYPATLAPPARPGSAGPERFVEENLIQVESVLGPYVGLRASLAGFAGGAHGFDHSRYAMVRAGQLVDVAQLGENLQDAAQMRIVELRDRSKANPPDVKRHDFRRAAYVSTPDGLRFMTLMRCCSWAENRGLLEVDIPIDRVPPALAPFAPGPEGWHVGPQECASIGPGAMARVGRDAAEPLDIAQGEVHLLGVRWLADTERLPDQAAIDAARARISAAGRRP